MADTLSNPDGGGMTSGATTAADNLTGTPTPGAGNIGGVPITNDNAPADPLQTGPSQTGTVPSGGQKAVPDDQIIASGIGNDTGGFGEGDGGAGINDGDVLPGDDVHPAVTASDTPTDTGGTVPTGGLSGGGTNAV